MFEYLLPKSAEVQWVADALELHQAAQEFRLEVERRQAHDAYCEWYAEMARQTCSEMVDMENDVNFFGWFCDRHSS
ncbi:MAG: hypothetical protein WBC73_18625 [Phormidesmis sp.]